MARSVVLSLMLALSACGPQSNLRHIKTNYQAARVELRKHLVDDFWIDNDPRSPELLARQWSLAGQWVAAWLSNRPSVSPDDVKTAILELAPGTNADSLACIALNDTTFLVTGPGPIGNVFIVTRSGRGYRLAWSTAQHQESIGKQDGVIAAWRPENARQGNRGPDRGAVIPRLGRLPADANGHPRFYIDGIYAQSAGGTVGAQISIWLWDGVTARPLIARNFTYMIDQAVGTRMEGDLLKVQQKEFFQTFFACGGCEERQTDWILRIAADGIEDLGDTPVVPELDTIDELFYRLIHGKSVAGMAAPEALARISHQPGDGSGAGWEPGKTRF